MTHHTPPMTTITDDLHKQNRPNSHVPTKAMHWFDAIIDDMMANPGTTQKATAQRLGRSPVTIGYIINSDLFKARYAQRRDQFNEELDQRLIGKLAKVAEMSLDFTLEAMAKKRDAIPLPLLNDISDKALTRLGYGPKGSANSPAVQVNVQQNGGVQQVTTPVSASALEAARNTLRLVESGRAALPPLIEVHEVGARASIEIESSPEEPTMAGGPSVESDGGRGDV